MRFSELEGRAVGVWGLGRETRSFIAQAAGHLPRASLTVGVLEDPEDDRAVLERAGATVVAAGEAVEALAGCDVLVRSPGVSIYREEIVALGRRGVEVTTATSLWMCERRGRRVIAVTGTKGKTTTAGLLAHLLAAGGHRAQLAGNIGRPALDLIDAREEEWAVVELSSYQTADLRCGPQVAVLTSLHREHADWHGSERAYREDKLRLFGLDGVEACVLPVGMEVACAGSSTLRFGAADGWHAGERGDLRHPDRAAVARDELPLRGRHNAANLSAALTALEAAGIAPPPLPEALAGFRPLPHRLQTVADVDGVEWVDDSISTTPESSIAALEAFSERPVVLVAGGQDRGQDYGELARAAAARGAAVVVLPDTGARLLEAARAAGLPADRAVAAADMAAAVAAARSLAAPGAVVLLSPAAPSYNSYANFERRGDHFAALAGAGVGEP